MSNNIHGIIMIVGNRRGEAFGEATGSGKVPPSAGYAPEWKLVSRSASPLRKRPRGVTPGSPGAIIGDFTSVTARRINRIRRTPGMPVWRRNYYEHVVRDERGLNAIRQYIAGNSARWECDTYNPAASGPDPEAAELWRLLHEAAPPTQPDDS